MKGVEGGEMRGPFVEFNREVEHGVVLVVMEWENAGVKGMEGAVDTASGRVVEVMEESVVAGEL